MRVVVCVCVSQIDEEGCFFRASVFYFLVNSLIRKADSKYPIPTQNRGPDLQKKNPKLRGKKTLAAGGAALASKHASRSIPREARLNCFLKHWL